jgi:hypothetical protein
MRKTAKKSCRLKLSDSLLKRLGGGEKIWLASISGGAAFGVAQLSQQHYVAAILSAGVGAAMSAIVLLAIAFASLVSSWITVSDSGTSNRLPHAEDSALSQNGSPARRQAARRKCLSATSNQQSVHPKRPPGKPDKLPLALGISSPRQP